MPGTPNRWSGQRRQQPWVPLRLALVAEVKYEAMLNGRFRAPPASCAGAPTARRSRAVSIRWKCPCPSASARSCRPSGPRRVRGLARPGGSAQLGAAGLRGQGGGLATASRRRWPTPARPVPPWRCGGTAGLPRSRLAGRRPAGRAPHRHVPLVRVEGDSGDVPVAGQQGGRRLGAPSGQAREAVRRSRPPGRGSRGSTPGARRTWRPPRRGRRALAGAGRTAPPGRRRSPHWARSLSGVQISTCSTRGSPAATAAAEASPSSASCSTWGHTAKPASSSSSSLRGTGP